MKFFVLVSSIWLLGYATASDDTTVGSTTLTPMYDHIKHIGLNDTHLIQISDSNYVILNPLNADESIVAFTRKKYSYEARRSGQIFSGLLPQHLDYDRAEQVNNNLESLLALSSEPSQLKPSDRFISLEYPLDGSQPRVIASQNYDSMEVRGEVNTTVVYDRKQFSTAGVQIANKYHGRIFWLANFLVTLSNVDHREKYVHSVYRDYLREYQRPDVEAIQKKILRKQY